MSDVRTSAAPPEMPVDPVRSAEGRPWFGCLDGLRGIAALLVVVFHVTGAVVGGEWGEWVGGTWLVRLGNVGVALFFVLSGFLLSRPFFMAQLTGRPAPRLGPYALRRLTRIVPAFWVALTVWLFLVRDPLPPGKPGDPYLLFYGFGQIYRRGYADGNGSLAVAWTLCIELTFYAVLPALAWVLGRIAGRGPLGRRVHVLAISCVVIFLAGSVLRWLLIKPDSPISRPLMAYWLPGHIGWFGAGMALSAISVGAALGVRPPRWVRDLAAVPAIPVAMAIGVLWLSTRLVGARPVQTAGEYFWVFVANGLIGALAVLPFVVGEQRLVPIRRGLASPPLRWLGEISYGLYLWHTIVLYQVNEWVEQDALPGGTAVRLTVVLALSLALAQASWVLLERPALRIAARLVPGR